MSKQKLQSLYSFIGLKTTTRLLWSVIVGICVFAVELVFAYAIQIFLLYLGIATDQTIVVPQWVPHSNETQVLSLIFIASILRAFFIWSQNFLRGASQEEFKFHLRTQILRWALSQRSVNSAETTSIFGERANQVGNAIKFIQTAAVQGTATVLLLGALLFLAPKLTCLIVFLVAFIALPLKKLSGSTAKSGKGLVLEWDKTHTRLVMGIRNLLLLRIYGLTEKECDHALENLSNYRRHILNFLGYQGAIAILPFALGITLICMVVIRANANHALSGSELLTYFYLLVRLLQNAAQTGFALSNVAFQWPQVIATWAWYQKIPMDFNPLKSETISKEKFSAPIGWNLKNISFRYSTKEKEILSNFNLEIKAGLFTAIIGPSGVGKSTLLALLLGELKSNTGVIEILDSNQNAIPIENVSKKLLASVGYVGPDFFIIDGTLRENLKYGLETNPSDVEIINAMQTAECGFYKDLSGGLEHRLSEQGHGLSAGQKQRLALARALLRNPSVLVLDEATANLDTQTEERLAKTLSSLRSKMTIIAVTHRPALAQIADKTIPMSEIEL